jgi:site-specific DNA-methyltransferase (adenine-specific)
MIEVHHGDCIEVMRTVPDNSVDSIVTDPPYGLGFMGKAWDALPPGEEWARECLRVLKPGGHLLAFGSARTWHRLAVAVEDAGFEIRDSIFWLYGSGFPKHRAALKPACEPVVMGRKPFKGSLGKNEAEHGVGALNIDASRIATGRWPANVILDDTTAELLDQQSGDLGKITGGTSGSKRKGILGEMNFDNRPVVQYSDTGGASRFFKVVTDDRGAISNLFPREFDAPFIYSPKAPKKERPVVEGVTHPTVKPIALMRWLVRLVTPSGGTVLEPFAGSGATVEACILEGFHCIAIERESDYLPLIQERINRQEAS